MPHTWIEKLNQDNSRNYKEKIIKHALMASMIGAKDADMFLTCVWYAYNPYWTYNIKKIPTTENITGRDNPYPRFFELLYDLNNRKITGKAAEVDVAQVAYLFNSDVWNTLLAPTILKDLRVGVGDKTFLKVLKKSKYAFPMFECQLATDSAKHPGKMVGKKRIEPKFDGVRVLTHVTVNNRTALVTMFSRTGKPFVNFKHIEEQIADNIELFINNSTWQDTNLTSFILDGEITSSSFQDLMKQVRRKKNVNILDAVYHVFDVIRLSNFSAGQWHVSQEYRSNCLSVISDTINYAIPNINIVKGINVDLDTAEGKNIMERYYDDMLKAGYEGILIKDIKAPYYCKRTTNWLKMKPNITVDLKIDALEEGTGKNIGRLGALVCSGMDDDRLIQTNVGSGFDDQARIDIWNNKTDMIGQIVEVRADVVTQNQDGTYSLRFPRFVRFRGMESDEKL